MPSEKTRSKEDTWRPEELEKSLKEIRGERSKHRDKDDRERRKDDINGDDRDSRERRRREKPDGHEDRKERRPRDKEAERKSSHRSGDTQYDQEERRRKEEVSDGGHRRKGDQKAGAEAQRIGKEENERRRKGKDDGDEDDNRRRRRQRNEDDRNGDENNHHDRDRERRGKDKERSRNREEDNRKKSDKDDDRRRSHRDDDDRKRVPKDDDRRRSHRDNDDRKRVPKDDDRRRSHRDDDDRRRSHRDDDDRKRLPRDDDKRRSHRDDDDDRRRSHKEDDRQRSHKNEDDDRRRSHREDDDRRKSRKDVEDDGRHKGDADAGERRSHKDRTDKDESRRRQKEKRDKDEREDRKHRSEGRRKSEDEVLSKEEEQPYKESQEKPSPEDNFAADDYEDDFEEYEEDFEDDDEDSNGGKPQNEVDEVLRALDAENDRLMAESRRSYASDSTELSDERFKSQHTPQNQRTFINFVSAKQRTLSDKTSNKTRVRGRDLLQLIDLDVASYDMFDLPPVKEYDLYIRNFGRTDTRQVYVQTNEDNIEREIQTEELDYMDKWSQHPADDSAACGRGDGEKDDEEETISIHKVVSADLSKLSKFINRAGQAISILLEEESAGDEGQTTNQSNISVSQGYSQLDTPTLLQGRSVQKMCFSPSQSNLLLTLFSQSQHKSSENPLLDDVGILCVWNTNEPSVPQKILVCDSCPSACCFSPSNSSLVFAGMVDGSMVLWDVREPSSVHHSVRSGDTDYCLRYPTYNTAGVLGEDNHQSMVITVTPTIPSVNRSRSQTSMSDDSGSGQSFQIVSVDETAKVNLWVVAEISSPDLAGSESDLGLSPGGRVKLLKSSSFVLDNPVKDLRLRTSLRVTCLQLNPADPNQFAVGTDAGFIVHGVRFGSKPLPRAYLGLTDAPIEVTCIDYSPFGKSCFLAGSEDGTVRLYHSSTEKALISWPCSDVDMSVVSVQWSRSRPAVFYILYSNSTLAVYDLVETDSKPAARDHIQTGRALSMSLSPNSHTSGKGEPDKHPQMVFTLDTGKTEIHSIAKVLVEQQPFEEDFLTSYLDRF